MRSVWGVQWALCAEGRDDGRRRICVFIFNDYAMGRDEVYGSAGRVNILPPIPWSSEGGGILAYVADMGREGGRRAPGCTLYATGGARISDTSTRVALSYRGEVTVGLGCDDVDVKPDPADNVSHCCPLVVPLGSSSYGIVICPSTHTCPSTPTTSRRRLRHTSDWDIPGFCPPADAICSLSYTIYSSYTSTLTGHPTVAPPGHQISRPNYCTGNASIRRRASRGCHLANTFFCR